MAAVLSEPHCVNLDTMFQPVGGLWLGLCFPEQCTSQNVVLLANVGESRKVFTLRVTIKRHAMYCQTAQCLTLLQRWSKPVMNSKHGLEITSTQTHGMYLLTHALTPLLVWLSCYSCLSGIFGPLLLFQDRHSWFLQLWILQGIYLWSVQRNIAHRTFVILLFWKDLNPILQCTGLNQLYHWMILKI